MCACLPRLIKPDRFLQEYFSDRCNTLGLWTTAAIVGSAYHAMLELPVTDAYAGTSGKVAELVSAAADTLVGFWAAFLGLCLQPLEMLALVGTLYVFVGPAAFGGVAVVVLAMLLSLWAGSHLHKLSQVCQKSPDKEPWSPEKRTRPDDLGLFCRRGQSLLKGTRSTSRR